MKKQFLFLLLFSVWFFIGAGVSFAARNIYITSDKSSLGISDELNISASPSGFVNGEKIYIKGAFFKEGSSNYFGLTKYNQDWVKNSTSSLSQREIMIGSWDNSLTAKPDYEDNGFIGPGDYRFKLGFYYLTTSGNASSINWSINQINIKIDSAPTKTPEPSGAKTSSSSSTSSSSKSLSPTKQLVITSTKPTVTANVRKTNVEFAKISRNVRAASEYAQIKPITNSEIKRKKEILGARARRTYVPTLFIAGVLLFLAAISQLIIKFLRNKNIL